MSLVVDGGCEFTGYPNPAKSGAGGSVGECRRELGVVTREALLRLDDQHRKVRLADHLV